jgi:hypothetical protein
VSWGNNGIEDYIDMTGAFPQGPWLPVYLVWSPSSSVLITDVVPHIFPRGDHYPHTTLSDDSNDFTVNTTVRLRTTAPNVRGVLCISGDWAGTAKISQEVAFAEVGDHVVALVLTASNVRLWWPNTWGQQHQHLLNVSFTSTSSSSDARTDDTGEAVSVVSSARKIGFRTVVFVNRQFTATPAGCDCTDLVPACDSPGRDCHALVLPPCCAGTDRGYTGKPRLFFRVNGVDLFLRGANFVSVDALESRANTSRYRQLIESARDSHFQIFRVNGDANYFKDEFYDLCSEMGILVWQEFMFSDCNYGAAVNASLETPNNSSSPVSSFLPNVRAEVQHQVRRLSHQPSIAMWISNNEILDPSDAQWRELFINTIIKTLVEEDTARPVWPAGNSNGWLSGFDAETGLVNGAAVVVRHIGYPHDNGAHEDHQYYFGAQNFQCVSGRDTDVAQERPDERFPDASFASEYGFLALPSFDSFSRYSTNQDWSLYSPLVQHSIDKIGGGAVASGIEYSFAADAPSTRSTSEAAFRRTTYLSQLLQAQCLSAETSHYRRGRDFTPLENVSAGTMGAMFWMLNSPYPSANWASIDVTGRWRLVQYVMAQTYTPLLLSAVATPLDPPPPPAEPAPIHNVSTCRTGVVLAPLVAPQSTWPPTTAKMYRNCASAAECCDLCAATPACVDWTFLIPHEKCYMANVSHSANVSQAENATAGSCANGACTHPACAACTGPDGDAQAPNFLIVHAANDRWAEADTSDMQLRIIHFANGRSHEVTIPQGKVGANSGAVVFRRPVKEVLQAAECASVYSCFALVSPRQPSNDTNDEGLALLANFKDLLLPAANITVSVPPDDESAQENTRRVTLTSDAVALFVMIHTTEQGRWDRNGVLLLPGESHTLSFVPHAGAVTGQGFGSTLHVDAANIARVKYQHKTDDDDADGGQASRMEDTAAATRSSSMPVLTKAQHGGNAWKCNWTETLGAEYCNGDNWLDWPMPDPFGAGVAPGYPECAMLPANWSLGRVVTACEQLCASADECIGFTLNPSAAQGGNPAGKTLTSCCFRAHEITSSPVCRSSVCKGVRCYQKKGCPTEQWVTVAVGRRPYVNERYGHVLLSSSFPAGSATTCIVTASVGGRVISNGSWTWDIRSQAAAKYEFDLSLLPISLEAVLNTTIRCDSLGWSTVKFRDFQRYPANAAPSSLSQVDHESRSILVGGRKFLMVGWYWSMNDNTVTNYTAYVVEQARLGVTVLMPYNFPLLMLHGRAELQKEILDACDATGMKLIMHVEGLATAAAAANTSMAWSNLTAVINAIKDHPATLGYYICDDCCDSQYQDVLSWVYKALKALDPYHITIGALNEPCFLQYTDGEDNDGKLAIDLPMYENYGNGDDKSLHTHTSPKAFENTARSWPMFWEPITNCPWAESSNEKLAPRYPGPVYSPLNVRSVTYAGLIGNASLPNLLYFDYFAGTEDALKQVVARIALEMQDLKPSLLPSVTAQQPSVRVFNPSLRARAFSEDVVGSTEVCIHVIILNTDNAFEAVQLEIAFRGLPSNIEAVLPFEGNADRRVPVVNGLLNDTAAPNSVNVYRIGCSVAAPDDSNLSPNPSFEEPFLLGGITAWSGGRAGWWGDDGHDSRARLYTDTSDPQHGRYSLRINVPSYSAAGLTVPWAQDCSPHCNADSDGFRLAANTSYTIQLWARSEPPGMYLQVVAGAWALDPAECNAFHVAGQYLRNQTLGGRTLNASWGRITVVYKAAPEDRHLQLQILSGRGSVFIDNTFIGARPAGGYDGQLAETRLAWAGNSRARED